MNGSPVSYRREKNVCDPRHCEKFLPPGLNFSAILILRNNNATLLINHRIIFETPHNKEFSSHSGKAGIQERGVAIKITILNPRNFMLI